MLVAAAGSPAISSARSGPAFSIEPYLRFRNLTKEFGSFVAVRSVSLDINPGEFVCFLGPSGCGKTTLLRLLAGLETQTSGTIEQDGKDISLLPPAERNFGIVFQSYALFPNLTVGQNILYGLNRAQHPRDVRSARLTELLELVGLTGSETKYPSQLSGGQQQRVAVARAIAVSPGLLLLDEPLSALDARVRLNLRHHLKRLQRQLGVTTIMVTHDQEEALTMADRIVVMNQGRIEQVGSPLEVYNQPVTPFVADFVGSMNLIPGEGIEDGRVRVNGIVLDVDREQLADTRNLQISVCIRPEDVAVRGVDLKKPNSFRARIDSLDFVGSFYRADLLINGDRAQHIVANFSMNAVRDLNLKIGDIIPVALPSNRLRVFTR